MVFFASSTPLTPIEYSVMKNERKVKDRLYKEATRGKFFYAKADEFQQENNEPNIVNEIVCGDSLHELKKLSNNCVDLIFTSPPYNFGLEYGEQDDANVWEEYFDKLFSILRECVRVLKYSGRLVINIQPLFSDYIPTHHIISNFLMKEGLIWKGEILWEKNNYNCNYTAWGSWKSPSSPYLKYSWEFVEVFCKGDLKKQGNKNDIDLEPDEFKKWVSAKWSIAPEMSMKKFGHPAMFPIGLAERVIKLFSYKNDFVLDPFNGVGTTTLTARKYHRRYLGIDIEEKYCVVARRRLIHTPLLEGLDI